MRGTKNLLVFARMYAPEIGRFLQTDPFGYIDTINPYAYCGNNPLNWIDPMGLKRSWTGFAHAAAGIIAGIGKIALAATLMASPTGIGQVAGAALLLDGMMTVGVGIAEAAIADDCVNAQIPHNIPALVASVATGGDPDATETAEVLGDVVGAGKPVLKYLKLI